MQKSLSDVVAKAIGPNTALVYITVFGSRSTVMVANARTRRLIGTVVRNWDDSHQALMYTLYTDGRTIAARHLSLEIVIDALKRQPGYVSGKNQNYSKAVYKLTTV